MIRHDPRADTVWLTPPVADEADLTVLMVASTNPLPAGLTERLDRLLTDAERCRLHALLRPADRRTYLLAHGLCRLAVWVRCGWGPDAGRFAFPPWRRPTVRGPAGEAGIGISLAHTEGLAVCAIGPETGLGVDAERLVPGLAEDPCLRSILTAAEAAWLAVTADADRLRCLIELWCLKEAFLKTIGLGLAGPVEEIGFPGAPPRLHRGGRPAEDAGHWYAEVNRSWPGHAVAVVGRRRVPDHRLRVRWHRIAPEALAVLVG